MAMANGVPNSELLQSQSHIWNQTFSFINSASLKCAIELGIPDIIHSHGQPMPLSHLISQLSINPTKNHCVYRLMRILVHSGFFVEHEKREDEQETAYSLTPSCHLLLRDNHMSLTPFSQAMLNPILIKPWNFLSDWLKNGDLTSFHTAHGLSLWEYANEKPTMNDFFNEAMASDSRFITEVLVRDCKEVFEGLNSLVDVGGGTGTVAGAIVDAVPSLKCTVLDLPHVVDGLKGKEKVEFVGGDMFSAIPAANAIFLKWILHDWSDKECISILKLCKEAIPSKENGGKVIIVDMVVGQETEDIVNSMEGQLFFDMLMMALTRGRERNEKEWANLFAAAGFSGYKISPVLGLRSLIEVYP